MDLDDADREGNPEYKFRGRKFASKEHIFFVHQAPWGEIKCSRAQIKALAEICAIGVTLPVHIIRGPYIPCCLGDLVSILCPHVAHRSWPPEVQQSDLMQFMADVVR